MKLRLLRQTDLDIIFEQEQDPEACYRAAAVAKDPTDRAAFDAHFEKVLSDPSVILRVIEVEGQVVGHLAKFLLFGEPEVTYWLGREFWGRGLATEALKLFLKELELRPLHARVVVGNDPSIRVLEKCGFVKVGQERFFSEYRGEEVDELLYTLE